MTTKQKYGIRKLSVGAASCFLGSVLYFGGGMVVNADEVQPTDVPPVAEETTVADPVTEMPEVPTVAETTTTPSEESAPAQEVAMQSVTAPTEGDTTLQVQAAKAINVRGISGTEDELASGIGAAFKEELTKVMDQEGISADYSVDPITNATDVTMEASGDFVVVDMHLGGKAIAANFDGNKNTTATGSAVLTYKDVAMDKYQKKYDLVFTISRVNFKHYDDKSIIAPGVMPFFAQGNNGAPDSTYGLHSDGAIYDVNNGLLGDLVGKFIGDFDVDFEIKLVDKNGNVAKSGLLVFGLRDIDQGVGNASWYKKVGATTEQMVENMKKDVKLDPAANVEAITLNDGVLSDVFTTKYGAKYMDVDETTGYIGSSKDPVRRAKLIQDSFEKGYGSIDHATLDAGFLTFVDAAGFDATWHAFSWGTGEMEEDNYGGGHWTTVFEDFSNVLPAEPDTLRYEPNGGTGEMTNTDGYSGEFVDVKENEFTRDGYRFIGWNTKADGSGETVTTEYLLVEDFDDVVYAQWEKIPTTEWVDEDGNPLKDPEEGTFPDKEGDDIPGYKLTEIKTEEGTTINVYHKVQTHWVDEQGNPLKDSVDGTYPDKEGDDISGWEIVRTYVNDKGDTVNVYKKKAAPVAPKAQPATPAPAPIQTGMESGMGSMAGTMFASLGALVGLKKKKED